MSVPFHFFTAVWGKLFMDHFINAVLPCFLSPGNFGSCQGHPNDIYFIFTTAEDEPVLRASPAFKRLQTIIRTEVSTFLPKAPLNESGKANYWDAWQSVTRLYQQTARFSAKNHAATIYLGGDEFLADGAFKRIREIADTGKKAILINALGSDDRSFIPRIKQEHLNAQKDELIITPRQLAKLAYETAHDYQHAMMWQVPFKENGGGTFFFPVEGEGVILRQYSSSPVLVMHDESHPLWPIENGFELVQHVASLFKWEDVYVVQDSDEVMIASYEPAHFGDSDYKRRPKQVFQKPSVLREAVVMKKNFPPERLRMARYPVRFHWTDMSARWQEIERHSDQVMDTLFACKEFLDRVPEAYDDLLRHFELIEALRAKQDEWTSLLANNLELVEKLPEPYRTDANAGIAWLYATDARAEFAHSPLAKVFATKPEMAAQLLCQMLCMLDHSGRRQVGDVLIDTLFRYFEQVLRTDGISGVEILKKVLPVLNETGRAATGPAKLEQLMPVLNQIYAAMQAQQAH